MPSESQMIRIQPTPEEVEQARKAGDRAAYVGSVLNGGGNVYGELAEIVVANRWKADRRPTREYDMILNGQKIDVKANHLKFNDRPPPSYYGGLFHRKQACDWFLFCAVPEDLSCVWVVGKIRPEEAVQKADYFKKGDVRNGHPMKGACYVVLYDHLLPIGVADVE